MVEMERDTPKTSVVVILETEKYDCIHLCRGLVNLLSFIIAPSNNAINFEDIILLNIFQRRQNKVVEPC